MKISSAQHEPNPIVQGVLYVDENGDGIYTVDIDFPVPDGAVLVVDLINKSGGLYYANDDGFFVLPDPKYSRYHLQGECGVGDIIDISGRNTVLFNDIRYQTCEDGKNIPSVNDVLRRYSINFVDDVVYSPVYQSFLPLVLQ